MATGRPFYSELGWAYDLLVDDPIEPWVEAVEATLAAPPPIARVDEGGEGALL